MISKYFLPGAAVIAAAIVLGSCSGREDTANSLIFETYTGAANYTLKGTAKVFGQDSDVVYSDSVSLILPLRINGADVSDLRDTIKSYALDIKDVPIRHAISQWLRAKADEQGYEAVADKNADDADIAQGFDIVSGFVVNLTPELLVYCVRNESYRCGAAHGMTSRRYINFISTDRGEVLTLPKLFTAEGLRALPKRIAEQARAMRDVIGTTHVNALPDNGNFYISSEGEIVFSYQPYEIASYAQGTIDVPFFPYELSDLMTDYAVSLFNLEDMD